MHSHARITITDECQEELACDVCIEHNPLQLTKGEKKVSVEKKETKKGKVARKAKGKRVSTDLYEIYMLIVSMFSQNCQKAKKTATEQNK